MVNPDKYIRKAYIDMCNAFLPTWEAGVPKTVSPIPAIYGLITNQTRNQTEESKGIEGEPDSNNEWLCTITIDLNRVQPSGYFGSAPLDDIEQNIANIVENDGLVVPGFIVKETNLILSQPLTGSTSTQSITRKIITYEHWLNNVTT